MFNFFKMWLLEHFNIIHVWKSLSRVRLFATPRDYTVHGSLQARKLEWVAIPFSGGSSQPRDQTQVSPIAGGFFTSWTTREALITTHVALIVFLHGSACAVLHPDSCPWNTTTFLTSIGRRPHYEKAKMCWLLLYLFLLLSTALSLSIWPITPPLRYFLWSYFQAVFHASKLSYPLRTSLLRVPFLWDI